MNVAKFGGSSVADAKQIKKVADIIKKGKSYSVVVVSAPGKRFKDDIKITDMLYDIKKNRKSIYQRFYDIETELGISHSSSDDFDRNAESFKDIDTATSRGEHYCARIIAEYLNCSFMDTEKLITINSDGRADEESYKKIQNAIKRDELYIVPGFYGNDGHGKIKTFSRGGSDITGSIFARAVNADMYENWTDVDGILAGDPRKIDNPIKIDVLTYEELKLIGEHGGQVFHPLATEPVYNLIPINIKNTNNPDGIGTMIVKERDFGINSAVCVCADDKGTYVIGKNRILETGDCASLNKLYCKYFGSL